MIKKILNLWYRHKTKKLRKIPLFTMYFDYGKYKKNGAKGSCDWMCHPDLLEDEFLREEMQKCVDYVRENYDMENFTKVWRDQKWH